MLNKNALYCMVGGTVLAFASLLHAQSTNSTPAAPPPPAIAMAPASKNPAMAPAGTYKLDLEHSSVIARVLHRGMSYNVLRFGVTKGALNWNPARASDIALDVTVDAKPYYAPIVYRIPPEGPQSLDVAQFPEARFVSTAVRLNGARSAVVSGQLTLMGVTRPITINAELVGVGKSMEGAPTVGFTGSMVIDTAQFTQKPMARMVGKVTVILDAEFIRS